MIYTHRTNIDRTAINIIIIIIAFGGVSFYTSVRIVRYFLRIRVILIIIIIITIPVITLPNTNGLHACHGNCLVFTLHCLMHLLRINRLKFWIVHLLSNSDAIDALPLCCMSIYFIISIFFSIITITSVSVIIIIISITFILCGVGIRDGWLVCVFVTPQ